MMKPEMTKKMSTPASIQGARGNGAGMIERHLAIERMGHHHHRGGDEAQRLQAENRLLAAPDADRAARDACGLVGA